MGEWVRKLPYKMQKAIFERGYRKERAKKGYCCRDLWAMDNWFLNLIPKMLREFREYSKTEAYPMSLFDEEWFEENKDRCSEVGIHDVDFFHNNYYENLSDEQQKFYNEMDKYNEKKWFETLDRMIFLFEEASEETCSKKNPYEKEYMDFISSTIPNKRRTNKELRERKKNPPPERDEEADSKMQKMHFEEELKLEEYRKQCKDEAMALFTKYLHNLWL